MHSPLPPLTLVLGGARSGKSLYAERLIGQRPAVYLATAQAFDAEMTKRLRLHRERRGPNWTTVEEPLALAEALRTHSTTDTPILVDCLTLWLSNLLLADHDIPAAAAALAETLPTLAGPVVMVANEVGLGIVPDNALARLFRDHAGQLNQQLAARAEHVVFIAAGLPLTLKECR